MPPAPASSRTDARPMLGLTMGDCNGIGPEILAKVLARPETWSLCRPIVLGDPPLLRHWLSELGSALRVHEFDGAPPADAYRVRRDDGIHVLVSSCGAAAVTAHPGTVDAAAGAQALAWIRSAVQLALDGHTAGLVTGPIHKEAIHLAGSPFPGHTELVAEMCGAESYRMCLFAGPMRAVHLSGHLRLRDALDCITADAIVESIAVAHDALVRLDIERPRIAVAGLNPHAGENGLLGPEEGEVVAPAIARAKAEGYRCEGPVSPDVVFVELQEGRHDCVVALYHDQGHIPLKLLARETGVNVTLGIPIVRTSVDHGTAFDIAGRGIASESSFVEAIRLAARLASTRASAGPAERAMAQP